MSIQVICPTCDQVHKVKDESAGKKLRCKGCQAVIPIPAASEVAEADPWDTGEMEEMAPRQATRQAPRQRKKTAAKPERARRSSSDGVPVTIIVPVAIDGLLIAIRLLAIVLTLIAGNIGGVAGGIVPLIVEITLIKGLLERSDRIRRNSIMLDCLGLGLTLACLTPALIFSSTQEAAPNMAAIGLPILIAIFAVQTVFWVVDLLMLMSQSARDYCNM